MFAHLITPWLRRLQHQSRLCCCFSNRAAQLHGWPICSSNLLLLLPLLRLLPLQQAPAEASHSTAWQQHQLCWSCKDCLGAVLLLLLVV